MLVRFGVVLNSSNTVGFGLVWFGLVRFFFLFRFSAKPVSGSVRLLKLTGFGFGFGFGFGKSGPFSVQSFFLNPVPFF